MTNGKDANGLDSSAGPQTMRSWRLDAPAGTRLRWNELAHPRTATFDTREEAERYKRGLEAMGFKVDIG